jgi:hypothetical protein
MVRVPYKTLYLHTLSQSVYENIDFLLFLEPI